MYSFMKRCRSASTSDEKAKHYIDILLSSVEYETFVKLMKIMRPVAEMRASVAKSIASPKAEGKGAPASVQSPAKASKEVEVDYDRAESKASEPGTAVADAKSPPPREDKFSSK
jgi:peptidoglycan hydrolase CwlO-like protein